ncbi:MAG: hotdog fold thioesterase [Pseudomonadota bacterium]
MTQRIWHVEPDLQALNELHENTAVARLGIRMTAVGDNYLAGQMPVDTRTIQPFGLMHGGAAALLLETLASAAANHCVDPATQICVGLELNCNHLRGVRSGLVSGRATALHIGRTSMVWTLQAHDEQQRLVTAGRLTSAVLAQAPT